MGFTLARLSVVLSLLSACAPGLGQVTGNSSSRTNARSPSADPSGNRGVTQPPQSSGHSIDGEAFDDGPRQSAYLIGGTGTVRFPVTTKSPLAQQFFDQGLGQLHGYWYWEAERSFRQVAYLDPDCAMAYWGMAMANMNNPDRARRFIYEAKQRTQKVTRLESLYIEALSEYWDAAAAHSNRSDVAGNQQEADKDRKQAYLKKLEAIAAEFPGDIETKAFVVFFCWKWRDTVALGDPAELDAILNQVFDAEPLHPAHHYRIHLWEDSEPNRALSSAARCGQAAPSIAHMWHMPGHIYAKLGRFEDAAYQLEASARVDHLYMMRDRVPPYRVQDYAHNNEWLARSLLKTGRVEDALSVAKNLVEVPRHPTLNTPFADASIASYGRKRLFDTLILYELWNEYIRLADTPYLASDDAEEEVQRIRWLAAAHLSIGNRIQGSEQMAELQRRLNDLKSQSHEPNDKAAAKALGETNSTTDVSKGSARAPQRADKQMAAIETALAHLAGLEAAANGNYRAAVELYEKAGDLPKPHLARAYLHAGNRQRAETIAVEAMAAARNEVYPLATYVEVLHGLNKNDLAKKAFEQLRHVAGSSDLKAPIFDRLADFAAELGYPPNWRLPPKPSSDVGLRPPLAALGPLRWQPVPAVRWTMQSAGEKLISLDDFAGKPVIVIFNLGHEFRDCAEQLKAFAALAAEFNKAGIQLVAVTSDSISVLHKAMEQLRDGGAPSDAKSDSGKAANETASATEDGTPGGNGANDTNALPITFVSNDDLRLFKAYHCFDDFEGRPLHGAFLIDNDGLIRWQEIGSEPFKDAAFLLHEARRLLALPRQ